MRVTNITDHPRPSQMSTQGCLQLANALYDFREDMRGVSVEAFRSGRERDSESYDAVIRKVTVWLEYLQGEIDRRSAGGSIAA